MSISTTSPALYSALKRALRPFVRLMLSKGVSFTQLSELLKEIYVSIGEQEFKIAGKEQTDSRISLLTGVHRKEVKRLREEGQSQNEATPAFVSFGMRLLAAWTEAPFIDEDGKPKALPRLSSQNGVISFEALVATVSKDIRSRVVLDEWLRLGIVKISEEDAVELDEAAFIPRQGFEEKAYYLGLHLHDHAAAIVHNLIETEKPPFLDRSVHYDSLPAALVEQIAQHAERGGMELLQALNQQARSESAEPLAVGEKNKKFTFGIYFYEEELPANIEPSSLETASRVRKDHRVEE